MAAAPTRRDLDALASVLRNPYGSAKGRDYAEQKYREHVRALIRSGLVTDRVFSHLGLNQFSRDGIEYPLLVRLVEWARRCTRFSWGTFPTSSKRRSSSFEHPGCGVRSVRPAPDSVLRNRFFIEFPKEL